MYGLHYMIPVNNEFWELLFKKLEIKGIFKLKNVHECSFGLHCMIPANDEFWELLFKKLYSL